VSPRRVSPPRVVGRHAPGPARRVATGLVVCLLLGPALASPLLANGGTVRLSRAAVGPYLVSVFTSPTPLRTGEIDVSVLVQDAAAERVVDVPVWIEARPVDANGEPVRIEATRQQATNKLFKAAKFDVRGEGVWELSVQVGEGEGGPVSFQATLTDPTLLDRPYLLAALILLPLAFLGWLWLGRDEKGPAAQSRIAATM
jgi:hypothetical protein